MYNLIRVSGIFAGMALLTALSLSPLRADETNKRTEVTFNAPVEIPGRVLAPGTYVFKLADDQADRTMVEIYNQDEDHLIATVQAIPGYRATPTGKTEIRFEERAPNAPQAVRSWFYPGETDGLEFVYPKLNPSNVANSKAKPAVHNAD